jgi:hypothetical protein
MKLTYLNLNNRNGGVSEIELFSKERFVSHIWQSPASPSEQKLRCEMLFTLCREFLLLRPPSDHESMQAWLDIGVEVCEQGRDCLVWDDCPGINATISEFGKVLTRLCTETHSKYRYESNERRKVTKILNQILDIVLGMKTEFAELISMCVLSNYVDLKRVSGKESVEVVFDHSRFMLTATLKSTGVIEKQKVDTLLYCLLWICLRFNIKLRELRDYLKNILSVRQKVDAVQESLLSAVNKVQYALEYNPTNSPAEIQTLFGRAFHDDHPLFKSYYTPDDDKVLNTYIRSNQMINDITTNIHAEDPYHLKSVLLQSAVIQKHIQLETEQKYPRVKQQSTIVSQSADPLSVTATYVLMPDQYTLLLHVRIHNNTPTNAYQVNIEVGVEGSVRLFESSPQCTYLVGDLPANSKAEFEREFLIDQFSKCSFFISVHCSHIKKAIGEDMLVADERKDAGLVSIRCIPFTVNLSHMLFPPKLLSHEDFLTVWETFESSFHKRMQFPRSLGDGPYSLKKLIKACKNSKTSGNIISCFYEVSQAPELVSMKEDQYGTRMFQQCLCSRTIFGDYILVVIVGVLHHNQEVYVCDWEFRTNNSAVPQVLLQDQSDWFQEMVDGAARSLRCESISVIYDRSYDKTQYDVFCDSSVEDKISIKREFDLNEAQSTVLFLQKWNSLAAKLDLSEVDSTDLPANTFIGQGGSSALNVTIDSSDQHTAYDIATNGFEEDGLF